MLVRLLSSMDDVADAHERIRRFTSEKGHPGVPNYGVSLTRLAEAHLALAEALEHTSPETEHALDAYHDALSLSLSAREGDYLADEIACIAGSRLIPRLQAHGYSAQASIDDELYLNASAWALERLPEKLRRRAGGEVVNNILPLMPSMGRSLSDKCFEGDLLLILGKALDQPFDAYKTREEEYARWKSTGSNDVPYRNSAAWTSVVIGLGRWGERLTEEKREPEDENRIVELYRDVFDIRTHVSTSRDVIRAGTRLMRYDPDISGSLRDYIKDTNFLPEIKKKFLEDVA